MTALDNERDKPANGAPAPADAPLRPLPDPEDASRPAHDLEDAADLPVPESEAVQNLPSADHQDAADSSLPSVEEAPDLPPPPPPVLAPSPRPQRPWVAGGLFLLTFLSAMIANVLPDLGARSAGEAIHILMQTPALVVEGLPFAVALMVILLAHEMGHYVAARRYAVEQSLPYFIPAPTIFGTLGALILLRKQPRDRGTLLRVAVAGPYAGLLVALPLTAWGLTLSAPADVQTAGGQEIIFGSSLAFSWLNTLFGPGSDLVTLHPIALAGWVGLFVTSINLIPAAQLDGGHVAYALFGDRQERISTIVVVLIFALGVVVYLWTGALQHGVIWMFWAMFLFVIGVRHPPVRNESAPLTPGQRVHGWVALLILVLTFAPVPIGRADAGRVLVPEESMDEAPFEERVDRPAEEFRL